MRYFSLVVLCIGLNSVAFGGANDRGTPNIVQPDKPLVTAPKAATPQASESDKVTAKKIVVPGDRRYYVVMRGNLFGYGNRVVAIYVPRSMFDTNATGLRAKELIGLEVPPEAATREPWFAQNDIDPYQTIPADFRTWNRVRQNDIDVAKLPETEREWYRDFFGVTQVFMFGVPFESWEAGETSK